MSATVYVTNMADIKDYSAAAQYGALRPITSGRYPIFQSAVLQQEIIKALNYSKDTDFLLIAGSSTIAAMCLAIWMMKHKTCKLLMYDVSNDKYTMRQLDKQEILTAIATEEAELESTARKAAR